MNTSKEWTKEEISMIKKEGGKTPTIVIANALDRSTSSIRSKAHRIGKSLKPVVAKKTTTRKSSNK